MTQIERLRTRLKNVHKNVIEYRMTVKEAQALLAEIDGMKKQQVPVEKKAEEPVVVIQTLDGGTF